MDPITLLLGGGALFLLSKIAGKKPVIPITDTSVPGSSTKQQGASSTDTTSTGPMKQTSVLIIPTPQKSLSEDYYTSGGSFTDAYNDAVRVRGLIKTDLLNRLNSEKYVPVSGFRGFGATGFVAVGPKTPVKQPTVKTGIPKLEISASQPRDANGNPINLNTPTLAPPPPSQMSAKELTKAQAQEAWAIEHDAKLGKVDAIASKIAIGYAKSVNESRMNSTHTEPNFFNNEEGKMNWYMVRGAFLNPDQLATVVNNLELMAGGPMAIFSKLDENEQATLERQGANIAQIGLYLFALQQPLGLLMSGDADLANWWSKTKKLFSCDGIDSKGNAKFGDMIVYGRESLTSGQLVFSKV